jgi:hypothetical protein
MQQALNDHRNHANAVAAGRADAPLLLAVCIDERERLQPLLAEVLRATDGLLVDANAFGDTVEFVGDPADVAALADAVSAALADANALTDAADTLRLEVDAGEIRIVGASTYSAASRAQQALRSLLVSLFAVALRANDLAALIYPDDALDAEHKEIVWRLLMRLPQLLGRAPASTLVVIAGDAELQFGLHCAGDPSLRWRVSDEGLQTRHPRTRDRLAVVELARLDRAHAPLVMLMLGAGASAGYLPLGNAVRDRALEHRTGTPVDRHNYADVAATFYAELCEQPHRLLPGERDGGVEHFIARLTLERVLREERHHERTALTTTLQWFDRQHTDALKRIDAERAAGTLASDPLVRLLRTRTRIVLVTVNFDQVIEAKAGGGVRAFITEEGLRELPAYLDQYTAGHDLPVPLIKAHGDIPNPETIVADVNLTRAGLARHVHDALHDLRRRLLDQQVAPLWHVGYSMRDLDLEDYWGDASFADRANERWVAPLPDPAVVRFIEDKREARWAREIDPPTLDESLVTLTAGDFFDLLAEETATRWC